MVCIAGIGDCGGSSPAPVADTCEEALKKYQNSPTTSDLLSLIASLEGGRCKSGFNYEGRVRTFCNNLANFEKQIGGGLTCKDRDVDRTQAVEWCQMNDRINTAVGSDKTCSRAWLGDKYDQAASRYCEDNPGQSWCKCFNVKRVCERNPDAVGCVDAQNSLENIKGYIPQDTYDLLNGLKHCRPGICEPGLGQYVPSDAKDDCGDTHPICGKDLDIKLLGNSALVLECNPSFETPDWWDDVPSDYKPYVPPVDKSESTITYISVASLSLSLSCCCLILLLMMLKGR